MAFIETTAATKIKHLDKRIRLVAGGTSASKTVSILLYLIAKAQSDKRPTLTSVVSESFPHLKRGAIRDFLNIMQTPTRENSTATYFDFGNWNKSDSIYEFPNGSKLEFFSADQPSKVRGPRRDRLFVNEANNIAKESWDQLLLRTREFAIADWNPVASFYMYEDYDLQDESGAASDKNYVDFLILTYKDNEALEDEIVLEIERRKENKQWWRVYGEGKRGEMESRIYKDWKIIDQIPHEARLERRGLDFGYSNDPSALVDVYYYNGGYILDERLYRKGMHNKDIADFINNLASPNTLVIADSAEPKSIDELRLYGVNALAAQKGPDSIKRGIDYIQTQKISVTKSSVNLIKEYRQYLWKTDKDGRTINTPDGGFDHLLDALRYGMESLRPATRKAANEKSGDLMALFGPRRG